MRAPAHGGCGGATNARRLTGAAAGEEDPAGGTRPQCSTWVRSQPGTKRAAYAGQTHETCIKVLITGGFREEFRCHQAAKLER